MKAHDDAEDSQRNSARENEPSLRELAEELSLELSSAPPSVVRAASSGKPAGAGHQGIATLFAGRARRAGRLNRRVVLLLATLLLLLAGGGGYIYFEIDESALLTSASATPLTVAPSLPLAENPPTMIPDSIFVATPPPELPDRPQREQKEGTGALPKLDQGNASLAQSGVIEVRNGGEPEIHPDLVAAFQSLQEGRLDEAKMLYQHLLLREPRNLDVLLGMAAVALRTRAMGEAGKLYFQVLEIEPGNLYAQAGLLNVLGSNDPSGSEAKLKQLLAEKPVGFLQFALGNLYAGQKRWNEAQQAYFQAFHLESDNSDYAFNLAVSLEQIGRPEPALTYYRRALALPRKMNANFERSLAEARVAQLQSMVD